MLLNGKKTKVLNISVYKSINLLNGLCIGNMWLETVDAAKLLGVLIDSHLTFGPHMAKNRFQSKTEAI